MVDTQVTTVTTPPEGELDGQHVAVIAPQLPGRSYEVVVRVSGDDEWEGWLDGQLFGANPEWREVSTHRLRVSPGPHVFAFRAWDTHGGLAGFIAAIEVEGQLVARTGDGQFRHISPAPNGFERPTFDDAQWTPPPACSDEDQGRWAGQAPDALMVGGTRWVWNGRCHGLGEIAVRYSFELP